MIIDLEQEKRDGLDESRLARDVMLLMKSNEMCEGTGPFGINRPNENSWGDYCCGIKQLPILTPHPRVPKPLREVRDELLEWLIGPVDVLVAYGDPRNHTGTGIIKPRLKLADMETHATVSVDFDQVADEPIALALGAVRLMEKQDANNG